MAFYIYHPQSTFKFGYAIDPRRPDDDKSTNGFFEWKESSIDDSNFGADVEFSIKEIASKKDLYEKMSLDLSLEAKYTFFKGKASFSWENEVSFSDKSIVYIVYGKKIYYPETFKGYVDFTEKGKRAWEKACQKKRIVEFQRIVGTDIVTQVRRGNSISLTYIFNCSSASMKEAIRAKLNTKWTSGSINVNFNKELYSLDEGLSIEIIGIQTGVSNLTLNDSKLSTIIALEPGDLPSIKNVISNFLNNVSKEDRNSSPILELNTKSIVDLEEIALSDYADDFRNGIELNNLIDRKIIELREIHLDNQKSLEEAIEYRNSWNKADFIDGSLDIINSKIVELKNNDNLIYEAFRNCINAGNTDETEFNIPQIQRLALDEVIREPYIIPLKWGEASGYSCGGERATFISSFSPVVHFKFPNAINHLFILKNSERQSKINREQIKEIIKDNGYFGKFWRTESIKNNVYIWGCFSNLLEDGKQSHVQTHKNNESANMYSLEIINSEGSTHFVNLSNPNRPIEIDIRLLSLDIPNDVIAFMGGIDNSSFRFV